MRKLTLKQKIKMTREGRYRLFEYMSEQHDVTLLESDMQEIENIILKNQTEQCDIASVGKRFCNCETPAYNYPEMVWCDKCGGYIAKTTTITGKDFRLRVKKGVSAKTLEAMKQMVADVLKNR